MHPRRHGRRRGCNGIRIFVAAEFDVVIDTVDTVRFLIIAVIAHFIHHIKDDQQTGSDTQRETQDIDGGEPFIFQQTTISSLEIVFDHGECLMPQDDQNAGYLCRLLKIIPLEIH